MDLTWKTAAWDSRGKQTKPPAFHYHGDRAAYAVQISQEVGNGVPKFNKENHTRVIKTEKEWNDWLDEVPQPNTKSVKTSLTLVICPRHADPEHSGTTVRNPGNLKHLPFPSEAVFKRLMEKAHIHQAIQRIINRGWPAMLRIEDLSGPSRTIYYHLRTTNALANDTAMTMTCIPSQGLLYAVLFGYTPRQANAVLERLAYSCDRRAFAIADPSPLINAFVQLEKVARFEQVERHADAMASLVRNFQLGAASARAPGHEDDPRDLVGLAGEVGLLRNALVSWARELERFRERDCPSGVDGEGPEGVAGGGWNVGEYLERTADEYEAMVRKCGGLWAQVSMTFQMETSSIARQEVGKMKALAFLTMVFLPATFTATFMSTGLFNWRPKDGESVLSPWWYVYFAVTGGLTVMVFAVYFFWARIVGRVFPGHRKLDRYVV